MRPRIELRPIVLQLLKSGQTTRSIADAIGVTQPSVSRLATGATSTLNADAAIRLIELAGGVVKAPELIDTPGAPTPAATPTPEVRDAA